MLGYLVTFSPEVSHFVMVFIIYAVTNRWENINNYFLLLVETNHWRMNPVFAFVSVKDMRCLEPIHLIVPNGAYPQRRVKPRYRFHFSVKLATPGA